MATKKTAEQTVPVVKHMVVTIGRLDGARSEREFTEEFAAKVAQGFKVHAHRKNHLGEVVVELQKTEDWPLTEFIEDIRSKLSS